jgi:hypothetical protein
VSGSSNFTNAPLGSKSRKLRARFNRFWQSADCSQSKLRKDQLNSFLTSSTASLTTILNSCLPRIHRFDRKTVLLQLLLTATGRGSVSRMERALHQHLQSES